MKLEAKEQKVLDQVSKKLGITSIEAEKALAGYYSAVAHVIKHESPAIIEMKHLGKFFYSQKILDRETEKKLMEETSNG
jgi:hypothetical protein